MLASHHLKIQLRNIGIQILALWYSGPSFLYHGTFFQGVYPFPYCICLLCFGISSLLYVPSVAELSNPKTLKCCFLSSLGILLLPQILLASGEEKVVKFSVNVSTNSLNLFSFQYGGHSYSDVIWPCDPVIPSELSIFIFNG